MQKTLLAVTLFLTSCASIFDGTRDNVTFNSTPSQARVSVNGLEMGTTPATLRLKKSENQLIEISKEGYEPKRLMTTTSFNNLALLNTVFWPFWLIDAATGAMWEVDPAYYNFSLDPKKG